MVDVTSCVVSTTDAVVTNSVVVVGFVVVVLVVAINVVVVVVWAAVEVVIVVVLGASMDDFVTRSVVGVVELTRSAGDSSPSTEGVFFGAFRTAERFQFLSFELNNGVPVDPSEAGMDAPALG